MNQDEHKIVVRRMAGLIAAASVLIAVYVLRLIFLQLVNSDSFKAQATNTTDYNFTVTAARGDIVDSAGRRIAASTTSYNVVLSKLLMGDEDLDAMLQRIVELLEVHGEKWNDSLLIGEPGVGKTAVAEGTNVEEELGDLLFSAVNVSRFVKVDTEEALNRATDKFIGRFRKVEEEAARQGRALEGMSLAELDKLWEHAKET